ncbi:OmpA family protein [Dokdonella ginsengisoli]|uniref:OmpA family protein n=1 Tax=Dokdonella ginsengisoli TaxID=363846 RepID=A0ABV9QQW6_9GAMM
MNALNARLSSFAVLLALAGCVSVPPAAPPELARLQNQLDELHRDPRVVDYGGAELDNADFAVNGLTRDYRNLGEATREQSVYVAERLVRIAQASALARYAEQRSRDLGAQREQLLARASVREVPPQRTVAGAEWVAPERGTLMAIQNRLPNMESRLDARGLVVRLGEYQFQPGGSAPTPTAERSLDRLASVLRDEPTTRVSVEGVDSAGGRELALGRAAAVRDYLDARGIPADRVSVRSVDPYAAGVSAQERRVDVVILAAR